MDERIQDEIMACPLEYLMDSIFISFFQFNLVLGNYAKFPHIIRFVEEQNNAEAL
jgi:hypothetical protein